MRFPHMRKEFQKETDFRRTQNPQEMREGKSHNFRAHAQPHLLLLQKAGDLIWKGEQVFLHHLLNKGNAFHTSTKLVFLLLSQHWPTHLIMVTCAQQTHPLHPSSGCMSHHSLSPNVTLLLDSKGYAFVYLTQSGLPWPWPISSGSVSRKNASGYTDP